MPSSFQKQGTAEYAQNGYLGAVYLERPLLSASHR